MFHAGLRFPGEAAPNKANHHGHPQRFNAWRQTGVISGWQDPAEQGRKNMAEVNAIEPEQAQEPEVELLDEATDEVAEEVEAVGDEPKEPKFDKEKFQKQNREVGNLKRQLEASKAEMAEIKRLLQERPKVETKVERVAQEDARDEVRELLDEVKGMADDDLISAKTYRESVSKLGSLIKKANKGEDVSKIEKELAALREKLEGVETQTSSSTAMSKAAAAFDETYEALSGQYQKFNSKAFKLAREELGEDADASAIAGLATGYLNALAKRAIKGIGKDTGTIKDKTANVKPAQSTKGTASVKKGAAPEPNLDELDMIDLRKIAMQDPALNQL